MPLLKPKAQQVASVPPMASAAPSFELLNTPRKATDGQALKDQIDRRTTAALLGITPRTLLRWHHHNFGPKRLVLSAGRYGYGKAEVEAWIDEHGRGRHRPRSRSKPSIIRDDALTAINCKRWTRVQET